MENFFKKLTNKLSSEYVVELGDDGKILDDELLKDNVKGADEIGSKSYMDLDGKPKLNSSSRKLNEPEEKITEKDTKDLGSANSNLNVENANEAQEEHSKPRRNRDLAFFF